MGQFLSHFLRQEGRAATLVRWRRQIFREGMVRVYARPGTVRTIDGASVHYLFEARKRRSYQRRAVFREELERHYLEQGEATGAIFEQAQVDLVHAHMLFPNLLFAGIAAERLAVPLVVTIHGMLEFRIIERYRKRCPTIASRVEELLGKADVVVCVSEEIAEECRRRGARRVEKIPGGIDTGFFQSRNGSAAEGRDILFVGSVRRDKGAHLLIRAFERFAGNGIDGDLVFLGNRLINGAVYDRARRNRRIHFLGVQDPASVRRALENARMVVLPSESEGLPLSILEAMACKRPVLVTKTGELTRVIRDGQNGFLIHTRGSEAIADLIKTVSSRSDLPRIGEHARRTAVAFDIRSVLKRHEDLYSSLLATSTSK